MRRRALAAEQPALPGTEVDAAPASERRTRPRAAPSPAASPLLQPGLDLDLPLAEEAPRGPLDLSSILAEGRRAGKWSAAPAYPDEESEWHSQRFLLGAAGFSAWLLDQPVDILEQGGCSGRTVRAVRELGVETVRELTTRTEAELFAARSLGPRGVAEVTAALGDAGLALATEA